MATIRNLLPEFIHNRFRENKREGEFKAVTMFIDISGFTPMTENLMRQGKVGAEILSTILNSIFNPVIDAVYERDGFISGFAGDAFTAIFPAEDTMLPCFSALKIQEIFVEHSQQSTMFGTFDISVKIGMSYGDVKWGIQGSDAHYAYYFKGPAIDNCAFSEHKCSKKDTVIDIRLKQMIDIESVEIEQTESPEFFKLKKMIDEPPEVAGFDAPDISMEIAGKFFPESLFSRQIVGEFRDIVPVFISFQASEDQAEEDAFVELALESADLNGGYFNSLDFGDKGPNMLILFGAPVGYENNIERAINFISMLKEKSTIKYRAGITDGVVYAGFVGSLRRATYTVLGDMVNLSARFMMKASWRDIWVSEKIATRIKGNFITEDLGDFYFKGKSEPVKVFKLVKEKKSLVEFKFENEMVGREKELEKALKFISPIGAGRNAGILYIYGEAGVGKSRLLYEIKEKQAKIAKMFVLSTDDILKKSMNPFITFFSRYFEQVVGGQSAENTELFEARWNSLINRLENAQSVPSQNKGAIIKELHRTKSLIGALFGLKWEGSLYEKLDAKGRFDNTVFAIKEFFKAESIIQPVILSFEDIHWMDSDSQEMCRALVRQMDEFPIAAIVLSRFLDDGSKPTLNAGDSMPKDEIVIDRLEASSVGVFVEKLLGMPASKEVVAFIQGRTEGNPFYIEQFCMYLKENSIIREDCGLYHLVRKDVEVPSEVKAILISRIDRLSKELKEIVLIASVIGREVDVRILSEVVNNMEILPILSEGKIERIWQSASDALYIFNHALLRDAAYDMQLTGRLKTLHKVTAESMERIYGSEMKFFSDIAFHYEKAEIVNKTSDYLQKAGDYAAENYKNDDAMHLYNRLLKYVGSDSSGTVRIKHRLGAIYKLIGKWDEANEIYTESLKLSENIGDDKLVADSKRHLGRLLQEKGKYDDASALFKGALDTYEAIDDQEGSCLVTGFTGLIHYYQGDLEQALRFFEKMLDIAMANSDLDNIAVAYRYLGGVNYYRGDYAAALEFYKQSLGIVEQLNKEYDIGFAKGNLGLAFSYTNDFESALQSYQESLQIYEKLGDKYGVAYNSYNMGELYFWVGRYQDAMNSFKTMLKIATELGSTRQMALAYNMIGDMYKKISDFDNAEMNYDKAIKLAEELNFGNLFCEFYYEKADLYFEMNDLEKSEKLVDGAIRNGPTGRKEFLFKAKVLKNRITAIESKPAAVDNLKAMLAEASDNDEKATIYYWLNNITGDDDCRIEAAKLYDALYKTAPREIYRTRLNELENN